MGMGIDPKSFGIERILGPENHCRKRRERRLKRPTAARCSTISGARKPAVLPVWRGPERSSHHRTPLPRRILDRETLSKEVAEGEQGVLVVTPLGRQSFPVIRFNTNDVAIKGLHMRMRQNLRKMMEIVGRVDDITKIRGVLFSPKTVEQLVRSEFPEIIEYELVVTREGIMDKILARIEVDPKLGKEEAQAVAQRLSERHKIKTNLSCTTKVEPPGTLPRYDLKAKRFKDMRGAH